jgi:hypothetical protein
MKLTTSCFTFFPEAVLPGTVNEGGTTRADEYGLQSLGTFWTHNNLAKGSEYTGVTDRGKLRVPADSSSSTAKDELPAINPTRRTTPNIAGMK